MVLTAIRVHETDDVWVALRDFSAGDDIQVDSAEAAGIQLKLKSDVPKGHKIAARDIAAGEEVHKYGFAIGRMTQAVSAGEHVHVHNLTTTLSGTESYDYQPQPPKPQAAASGTFLGYRRHDHSVGIRNEIWILCTVGCVARTSERLAKQASERFKGRVDGIYALTHPLGCSQLGDDLSHTRDLLASLAMHPNAGGDSNVPLGFVSLTENVLMVAMALWMFVRHGLF